ncbi:hypothetical protein [Escherichia coli]|uniref:hypothetical protein n=1 Tax=Escherichia coli TaxID=562 RepID=UPI0023080C64|nr:hypothetical protein [Escherichia coli]WCE57725.1 hypothetical protein PL330_19970 [Escherichia coli]
MRSFAVSDYEQIDYNLFEMLSLLSSSSEIQEALNAIRQASSHLQRRQANAHLRALRKGAGICT